jgi:hypothetical protein
MASSNTKFTTTNVNAGAESGADQYNALEGNLGAEGNTFSHMQAPQSVASTLGGGAQIDNTAANNVNASQNQLVGQLQAQADGTGPSLASGMLKQGTDRSLAGQQASLASNPGMNPALASRMQADNTVGANQQLAQATAQQRMQDQINAQSALGGVLNNQRTLDQTGALSQAQLDQQVALANQDNLQQTALANQTATLGVNQNNATNALSFGNALGSTINSGVSGQQFVGGQAVTQNEWQQEQQAQQERANAAGVNGLIGGAIGGAASIASGGLTGALGSAKKAA